MAVRIEPWGAGDLALLHKTMGDPEMTEHLGGPESPQQIAERHERLQKLADSGKGRWFKIVDEATGDMRCNDWRLDLSDRFEK